MPEIPFWHFLILRLHNYADQNGSMGGITGSAFKAMMLTRLFKKSLFSHEKPVLIQSDQGSLVKEALYDIYSSRGSQYKNSLLMTSMLYRALALFLPDSTDHSSHDLYSSYVTSAVEYIHHNYSYTITIDDIASYIGISRSHLFRAFKLHTGTSPKEYLTNYRIAQACNLLKQSDLSVQSVANSVGFDNGLYFSKVFHQKKWNDTIPMAHSLAFSNGSACAASTAFL